MKVKQAVSLEVSITNKKIIKLFLIKKRKEKRKPKRFKAHGSILNILVLFLTEFLCDVENTTLISLSNNFLS